MADEKIEIEIQLDEKGIKRGFSKVKKDGKETAKSLSNDFDSATEKISRGFSRIVAPAIALAGAARSVQALTTAFADFESALVGVQKTTNISGSELEQLGERFQDLSREIPVSTQELLGFAQQAGQFGVTGAQNIELFAETVAKLSVAVDGISGEEAAESLVRILNVTNEGVDQIDKLASVIVALGNNIAANEGQITEAAQRISRAGAAFGVSAAQAATLGAALSALGITSEIAGTTVSKTFQAFNKSIITGGDNLRKFADITDTSVGEFKKLFEDDAAEAFNKFILGLNKIQKSGGNVSKILNQVGLSNERVLTSLLGLTKGSDQLTKALEVANAELGSTNALNEEAERAFSTLSSQIKTTANSLDVLITTLGSALAPVLTKILKLTSDVADGISNLFRADEETVSSQIAKIDGEIRRLEETLTRVQDSSGDRGVFGSILESVFGGPGTAEEIENKILSLQQQKARLDSILQSAGGAGGEDAERDDDGGEVEGKVENPGLLRFIKDLEITVNETAEVGKKVGTILKNGLAKGVSQGIQATINALQTGQNAFEAFGKGVLAVIADLAIQLGETLIVTGIGIESLKSLSGAAAIAAGAGLVALGTLLKSAFGDSAISVGTASGAPSDPTLGGGDTGIPEDDIQEPSTSVAINVQGDILDSDDTGLRIAKLLQKELDKSGNSVLQVT